MEFAVEPDSTESRPWTWFKFLAQTDSGYILIETDSGLVTVNPHAARERIAFEQLMNRQTAVASQRLLIPETVQFTPPESARIEASLAEIAAMGFSIEKFGRDTFKIDAVPQLTLSLSSSAILSTISRDLGENQARRAGIRWKEEIIAKSIARSFAGSSVTMTEEVATKMIEELCRCAMPYVCPRGKPVMIFTSTRELNRKFERD
jgi:DNA mismatch repair protein MutL